MKYFLALLVVLLVAVGLASLEDDEQSGGEPVTGLPWQIDRLPGGESRVFDITLGQTTLGEVIERHGDDEMKLAIIAAPQEVGTLEA